MTFIVKYGWHALLIAMVGDLLIPFILTPFYSGYSNSLMTISALGNKQSPVRSIFNVWMLLEGVLFIAGLPAIHNYYSTISRQITNIMIIFILIYAIGACIVTCFFNVNETKNMGIIAIVSFIIAFILFILFVMADKPQFANTIVAKEGLWQRLNLFFMYVPLVFISIRNILGRIW